MRRGPVEIAVARDSHTPGIVEVWKEFMDFHRDIDPHFTLAEDGHVHFEKRVQDLMASDDGLVLVALDGAQVVGYSLSDIKRYPPVVAGDTYGHINDMAVPVSPAAE